MPQELKQVNGRWVVTGAQQSSDLAPTVKAGFKPAAPRPSQARPQPRPWWSKLWNDLQYEFKRPEPPVTRRRMSATEFLLGQTAVGNLAIHKGSLGQQGALGAVGATDNALKMGYSLVQRHVQRKPKADPTSGSFGNALSQGVEAAYKALGAKPPSQMNQEERNLDQTRRSVALNVALAPVTPGFGAAKAATALGMGLRGGAAFAFNEALSTYLDDQTGGNIVNFINGLTGAKLPGAVNVGQDDMVDAANKSLLPNAATSLAIGAGAGAAVSAFRNIRRNTRAHRAVQQEVRQRAKQEAMGILQKDEADGLDFTPQAKQPAQPAPAPAPEPTFQEANAAMEERLGMRQPAAAAPGSAATASAGDQIGQIFAAIGKGLTESLDNAVWEGMQGRGAMRTDPIVQNLQKAQGLIGRPLDREEALALAKGAYAKAGSDPVASEHWIAQLQEQFGLAVPAKAPEPAPIPTIENATTENFGKAKDATTQPLPEGDPSIDYWTYDPDLPESTALGKSLEELSDNELQTVLSTPDVPVVERVNQVIEARAGIEPQPPVSAQMVMAPTDRLAEDYLASVPRKLGKREDHELRPLFDPEVNPQLWQRAQALTGVDDPAQLSKTDMIDSLTAMAADGQAPIVNRVMGSQMLPTGEVQAAPVTFQYKGGVNDAGEQIGNSLEGLERWDPNAEGIIQVWRDADGEIGQPGMTYVVNGHNRLAAAKRMGIPSMRVEYLDAPTAAEARLQGAISNVSDGKGTVFDAAKLAREYGITDPAQLKAMGKPGASGFWKEGIALGRLPEDVFTAAVNGQLGETVRKAVIIGESGANEETMRSAYRYLVRQGPDNVKEGTLREMLAMAQSSPAASSSGGRQKVLFEGTEWEQSFNEGMLAKADLAANVRQLLSREKRLFGLVGRQAGQIERVGQVDAGAARGISGEANRALTIFDELKYMAGPVGDLLNEGTQRILAGEDVAQVAKGIKNRLAASIAEAMGKEVGPAVDVVQEDMFAAATRAAEPIELTPDERLAAEAQLLQQAAANGEIRPPTAPIPDLPEPAQVRLDELDGSPAFKAARRLFERMKQQAAIRVNMDGLPPMPEAINASEMGMRAYKDAYPDRAAQAKARTAEVNRRVDEALGEIVLDPVMVKPYKLKEAARKTADPELAADYRAAAKLTDEERQILQQESADVFLFDKNAAQATADEIRLAVEHKQSDAALAFEQQQALRDATEYEALTFDEKKDLGLAADLDEAITPEVMGPEKPPKMSEVLGNTLRALAESDARMFRELDNMTADLRQAANDMVAPARPVRPEPLRLTAPAEQPEFALPKELSKAAPRYGRAEIRFESDLDRTAYVLANDAVKPSKSAAKFRAALEAAGMDVAEVTAHGKKVKAALKQAARNTTPGEPIQLPSQPFGETAKPPTNAGAQRVRQQIEANNQTIDDIRRKAQQEGC